MSRRSNSAATSPSTARFSLLAGIDRLTGTPKHGSWLNLVEGFFSKFARSVLRHIWVTRKYELKQLPPATATSRPRCLESTTGLVAGETSAWCESSAERLEEVTLLYPHSLWFAFRFSARTERPGCTQQRLTGRQRIRELSAVWFSCTRGAFALPIRLARHDNGRVLMKKLALATAAVLALLSIAGCGSYVGKGKAPPPVVTKG